MKYLIYGAGTIGVTYAWLLSQKHKVDMLVKPERLQTLSQGIPLAVKDFRKKSEAYEKTVFYPNCVTEIDNQYDGVLVAVNRCQLQSVLPVLAERRHLAKYIAFMQNGWEIESEVAPYIAADHYIVAFPSSVGGGRDENGVQVILFDEATRMGGSCQLGIDNLKQALLQVGIKTREDAHIFDWMKVHYLQQSITAGAILECGAFAQFARDKQAVKKMVKAFREGIAVCASQGVCTGKTFPANMFRLPLALVCRIMQSMFLNENTAEMVNNHMKRGLPEWVAGYLEVLEDGLKAGLPMTAWKSYYTAVTNYLKNEHPVV